MSVLSKLQTYMQGRRALLPIALILSAISALSGMLPYLFVWLIIRELFTGKAYSQPDVLHYAWWALGTAVAGVVLYFFALSCSHLAAFRVETNMRKCAMARLTELPLGFFDRFSTGKIRKIIDENASTTHSFLAHQLPDLSVAVLVPITAIVLILTFDWRLGLACLVPIVCAMYLMRMMMSQSGKEFMKKYMTSLEEMNTEAVEYVRGIPVVKVFQQTVFSFKNFHKSITQYRDMVVAYTKEWEKPMSVYVVIINGFLFFLVPVAILLINRTNQMTAVLINFFLYVLIAPVFSVSIMRSMHLNQAFEQAKEAVIRLENLINVETLSEPESPKLPVNHSIQFDQVSFSYPGTNQKAIDQVSFSLPAGKTVALIGPSGSGKTTISRLLPRFWDADEGQVSIGGIDVKEIGSRHLMELISFVFQNTRLFKTSLLENVKCGNPAATDEEIERAIDLAQCREIIDRLPEGLNTQMGSKGTYLSGGEQQRVALARAILKDSPIVVLDEATAFTDPENEHLIQRALGKLAEDKTVLMIAHRLTSVVEADEILVVSQGTIVERGKHAFLLEQNGLYTQLWNEYQQATKWTIKKDVNHV